MRQRLAPYWLILPGGLWLGIFFVVPMAVMVSVSLQTGDLIHGFQQTFAFDHYSQVVSAYHTQLLRALWYGFLTTVLTILLAYPMAYWIAFYGGRHKSTYLFLILLPFLRHVRDPHDRLAVPPCRQRDPPRPPQVVGDPA